MALPIEKMDLPTLRKAESKQSILRPIPLKKVAFIMKEYFKHDGYEPDDQIRNIDEIHRMVVFLRNQLLKLTFVDWRYSLTDIYLWDGLEEVTIDLLAQKKNLELQLHINQIRFTDYDLKEYGKAPDEKYPYMTVMDFIGIMMDFFKEANEVIEEWDNISLTDKPIITERPPFDGMREWIFEKFREAFEEDYEYSKEEGYYKNWKEYLLEREVYPAEIITDEIYDINYNSMSFGPYALHVEFLELGGDPYYGFYVLDVYIHIYNVGMSFLVDSLEISKSGQYTYDEVESLLDQFEYDLYGNVVQWNEVLARG